jgi:hypothetical protein
VPTMMSWWQTNCHRTDVDGNRRDNDQIKAANALLRKLRTLLEVDVRYISVPRFDLLSRAARLERYFATPLDAPEVSVLQQRAVKAPTVAWHAVEYTADVPDGVMVDEPGEVYLTAA